MTPFEQAIVILIVIVLLAASGVGRKSGSRYVRGPGPGPKVLPKRTERLDETEWPR